MQQIFVELVVACEVEAAAEPTRRGQAVHALAWFQAPKLRLLRIVSCADIKAMCVEPVTLSDGSLGCPQPGEFYTQVLVRGYWIVFDVEGMNLTMTARVIAVLLSAPTCPQLTTAVTVVSGSGPVPRANPSA